ncbi:DNA-directed RNA polymerase [Chromobacterium haemolyticum]|uniref:DNA-directed RNA polymerase n=1 Tax=Chromobacterium haemolyticum TaxID=394935 RepID=UPI000D30B3B4|nr:DNA-directed RNA polymerase [Chromobacterium haemolyticum]PTU68605.1 hypothetical protein DBB33_03680 [Chromobacterium haemolyticum]
MFNSIVETALKTPYDIMAAKYGEEMASKQLELEYEAKAGAERKVLAALAKDAENGVFHETLVGTRIIGRLITPIANRLAEWTAAAKGRRGVRHSALQYFLQLPEINEKTLETRYQKLAYVGLKNGVSASMMKNPLPIVAIYKAIGRDIEEEIQFTELLASMPAAKARKIRQGVKERAEESYKRCYMRAIAEHHKIKTEAWPTEARLRVGEVVLNCCIEAGIFETHTVTPLSRKLKDSITSIIASEGLKEVISKYSQGLMLSAQRYLPTVIPPRPWKNAEEGGYWTEATKTTLFRIPSSAAKSVVDEFHKELADIDMQQVLDAVNRLQATPWQVNSKVLDVARSLWRDGFTGGAGLPGIEPLIPKDKAEARRVFPDLPESATDEEIKAHRKKKTELYKAENRRASRALRVTGIIETAQTFRHEPKIYMPHSLDTRGRLYPIPAFNPQGDDLTKALLVFASAGPIGTEENLKLFKMHGANVFGHDKWSIKERVKWVDENSALLLEVSEDPKGTYSYWSKADSPFCFLAFCFEYAGYIRSGLAFESRIVLAFDGSCSGIQHFSAMLRDEVGGHAVNLVARGERQDIYQLVADRCMHLVAADAENGSGDVTETRDYDGEKVEVTKFGSKTLAQQWLMFGIGRNTVKRSVMTLAYGSKEYGFREQVLEDTIQPAMEMGAMPFSSANQAAGYLAHLIWTSVQSVVVKAVEAMKWLQKAAGVISKANHPIKWFTPDGMPVQQFYYQMESKRVQFIIGGTRRLFTVVEGTATVNPVKQASGIAPNFVHSLDGCHMRMTINHCHDKEGIRNFGMIHDSFGTSADKAVAMFKGVRATMVRLYDEFDPLAAFATRIKATLDENLAQQIEALPQKGSLDLHGILESEFAFT